MSLESNNGYIKQEVAGPYYEEGRDSVIRQLLPYDYDQAVDEGLIDMFYYNPANGDDGFLHTLVGDAWYAEERPTDVLVAGFHHKPSAELVSPKQNATNDDGEKTEVAMTRVDLSRLEGASRATRRNYLHLPFEPYTVPSVIINGLRRKTLQTDPETGKQQLVNLKNTMFPDEYDTYGVLKLIKEGYDNLDLDSEHLSQRHGIESVVVEGRATLIDGKTKMRMRYVLEKRSRKIQSAMPITGKGYMRLSPEEAEAHLFNFEKR
jgi:hypothetical protein